MRTRGLKNLSRKLELQRSMDHETRNDVDSIECVGDLQCNVRIAGGIGWPE